MSRDLLSHPVDEQLIVNRAVVPRPRQEVRVRPEPAMTRRLGGWLVAAARTCPPIPAAVAFGNRITGRKTKRGNLPHPPQHPDVHTQQLPERAVGGLRA